MKEGNRPLDQSKLPESTMTPPMEVPWPPIHLVADCDDDVGAVLDGPAEIAAAAEGVVHHQGDSVAVGELGEGFEIGHVEPRVSEGLDIDRLGRVGDGRDESSPASSPSTKSTSIPRRGRVILSWL